MNLTKTKHVWRSKPFTACDIYKGDEKIASAEYPANVGIARLCNLAKRDYGEGVSVRNIEGKTRIYHMPLEAFYQMAENFIKEN